MPAPMAATAIPIQTTSLVVGMLALAGLVAIIRINKAQTTAFEQRLPCPLKLSLISNCIILEGPMGKCEGTIECKGAIG